MRPSCDIRDISEPPKLVRALYVSRAAARLGPSELYGIIRAAHARNRPLGLTGALVFLDGWFAQVIEGPEAALGAALGRIGADPRHRGLELRLCERAFRPLFAGQPMALRTAACLDPELLAGFGYRPGFPVAAFPAEVLLEFILEACSRMRNRDRRRAAGALEGRATGALEGRATGALEGRATGRP